jgi:hypothetical protein
MADARSPFFSEAESTFVLIQFADFIGLSQSVHKRFFRFFHQNPPYFYQSRNPETAVL